jgi:AAA15 family ATPase/GTPase
MLVQFSVTNYKTFKEKATLSMVASNYDKKSHEQTHVAYDEKFKLRLLKSAVVYGANASGKTKLIEAMLFMKEFVQSKSFDMRSGAQIPVDPFRLDIEMEVEASEFEVVFLFNEVQYRYGFAVTKQAIESEWLFVKSAKKEVEIFYRNEQTFEIHNSLFPKGKKLVKDEMVREQVLLLSLAEKYNDELALSVFKGFDTIHVLSGLHDEGYKGFTMTHLYDAKSKEKILQLLQAADLHIHGIDAEKLDSKNLPEDLPEALRRLIVGKMEEGQEFHSDVMATKEIYDDEKQIAGYRKFSMAEDESSGTNKFFSMLGPVIDVLENGYTLFVDELDAKLHPNLVESIAALFNSRFSNPYNAQLIFNTHNTNLLQPYLFRRDQVWFTEKDKYGAAKLYSLDDFDAKHMRKNEAYEANYIGGKYGATPSLNMLSPTMVSVILNGDEE